MKNTSCQIIRELEAALVKTKQEFLEGQGWRRAVELLEDWMWEKDIEGKTERLPLDMAIKYEEILQEMRNASG